MKGAGGAAGPRRAGSVNALARGGLRRCVAAAGDAWTLLRRAAAAVRAYRGPFLLLGVAPSVAYAIAAGVLEMLLPDAPTERQALEWTIGILALTAAWIGASLFGVGVLARLSSGHASQRPVSPEAAIEVVTARLPRLAVAALLYVAAVGVGLALLVLPGIVLAARLIVWPQGVLLEYRAPVESLRWSREVLRGRTAAVALAVAPALLASVLLAAGGYALALAWGPWAGAPAYAAGGALACVALPALSAVVHAQRAAEYEKERAEAKRAEDAPPPDDRARYVCPRCGREYRLPRAPPAGTLCPSCRKETGAQTAGR